MALWALWDPETKNVIRIENDDPKAIGGMRTTDTGAARSLMALKRYPLEVEYPETYVPRFPRLLGRSIMVLKDGVVHQQFPEADYSEQTVRAAVIDEVKVASRKALSDTDWAVVRQAETGRPVPDDINETRATIRTLCAEKVAAAQSASPSDLLDFDSSLLIGDQRWTAATAFHTAP